MKIKLLILAIFSVVFFSFHSNTLALDSLNTKKLMSIDTNEFKTSISFITGSSFDLLYNEKNVNLLMNKLKFPLIYNQNTGLFGIHIIGTVSKTNPIYFGFGFEYALSNTPNSALYNTINSSLYSLQTTICLNLKTKLTGNLFITGSTAYNSVFNDFKISNSTLNILDTMNFNSANFSAKTSALSFGLGLEYKFENALDWYFNLFRKSTNRRKILEYDEFNNIITSTQMKNSFNIILGLSCTKNVWGSTRWKDIKNINNEEYDLVNYSIIPRFYISIEIELDNFQEKYKYK